MNKFLLKVHKDKMFLSENFKEITCVNCTLYLPKLGVIRLNINNIGKALLIDLHFQNLIAHK